MLLSLIIFCLCSLQTRAARSQREYDELWWDECGVSKYDDAATFPPDLKSAAGYIVGGVNARENEFPWQTSLQNPPGGSNLFHFCGGVIVHPLWVLTAAHCVVFTAAEDVVVVVGDHDLDEEHGAEMIHTAQEIFVHEEYGRPGPQYNHDIAIILLDEAIEFNENIQPACKPRNITYVNDTCQSSGWGTMEWGIGIYPEVLQWTEMTVVANGECEELLQEVQPTYYVSENMICGGHGDHDERDTCQGDSGGPFTVQNEDGRFEVAGLVSWGYQCAAGTPGVYTRVSQYNQWVTDKIEKNTPEYFYL